MDRHAKTKILTDMWRDVGTVAGFVDDEGNWFSYDDAFKLTSRSHATGLLGAPPAYGVRRRPAWPHREVTATLFRCNVWHALRTMRTQTSMHPNPP